MFRLREIWESQRLQTEEFSPDAFCSFIFTSDRKPNRCVIAIGSFDRTLRFYFPDRAGDSAPATETSLKAPILQLRFGPFILPGKDCLAILHPNQLLLCEICEEEETLVLKELQTFMLSHSAFNFIAAPLEGIGKPSVLVVQSLDGFLTVLNVGGPVLYKIPHFFLPGPFIYVNVIESFIFAASDFSVSCYRRLMVMGNQKEKEIADEWQYVFGEQVVGLHFWHTRSQVVEASTVQIAVVGERMIAVLNEAGKLKSIQQHSGNAIASYGYSTENGSHNLVVANSESVVTIYVNFQKVWQLKIERPAMGIDVISLADLQGLLTFFSVEGTVTVGYLGTHDSRGLELPSLPVITEEQLQAHMAKVNDRISEMPLSDHLQVFVNVSKTSARHIEIIFQRRSSASLSDVNGYLSLPPTVSPVAPFAVQIANEEEVAFRLDLNATQAPPARRTVSLGVTFSTLERRILSKSVEFEIPFEFWVRRVEGRVKGEHRVILQASGGFASIGEMFPNHVLREPNSVAFVLANGDILSISTDSKNKRYRLESDSWAVLGFGINLLLAFSTAKLSTRAELVYTPLIDVAREHFNLRVQERDLQQRIHALVGELESVQKALMVGYEAATPEPLDDLTELLKQATEKLKAASSEVIEVQRALEVVSARVEAAVYTFQNLLIVSFDLTSEVAQTLQKYIPTSIVNSTPGWEECMIWGVMALLRKLAGGKGAVSVGSPQEFINNFDVLVEAFTAVVSFFESQRPGA
jgi:hypothetical protein